MFYCEKYHCNIAEGDCITRQENVQQAYFAGKAGDPGCKSCRQGYGVKKRHRRSGLKKIEKNIDALHRVLAKLPDKTHQDQKRAERGRNALAEIRDTLRSMSVVAKMPDRGKRLHPEGRRAKRIAADMTGFDRPGM